MKNRHLCQDIYAKKSLVGSAFALHHMSYNFCRIHKSPRITPAMAFGMTDCLWGISDIVKVLEEWELANAGR
jgi:hypothetical protein